jgi:hypothetical protein
LVKLRFEVAPLGPQACAYLLHALLERARLCTHRNDIRCNAALAVAAPSSASAKIIIA